jgi:hypothetical protein
MPIQCRQSTSFKIECTTTLLFDACDVIWVNPAPNLQKLVLTPYVMNFPPLMENAQKKYRESMQLNG